MKIETSPILVTRPNGRLGLPTKAECEAECLDEFTTTRILALRDEITAAGGDPDAVDVMPDEVHTVDGRVDWEAAQPYIEGSAVMYPVDLPWWQIWWRRLRFLRWDVPMSEMQTFHAIADHTADR